MKNKTLKILIISIFALILFYSTKSYALESGTVRMQVNGGTAWTNIDVSSSYAECESLNSGTSTLGTTNLNAHLSTDADWSAMAIFTVSQYGGQKTNTPAKTNGNNSGIINIGTNYHQAAGVQGNTTTYVNGLYENGQPKKYVTQWSKTMNDNNFVGFSGTYGWYQSWTYWGNNSSYPLSIKQGLFGFNGGGNVVTSGRSLFKCFI